MVARHVVMQSPTFTQRHLHQAALGGLRRLAYSLWDFTGLTMTEADPALLIAYDHKRRETEAPTALDDLRHAVNVNELIDELAVALFAISFSRWTCHL
jgi:hypothetical protein